MTKSWIKFETENETLDIYWKDVEWLREVGDRYYQDEAFSVEMIGRIDGTNDFVRGIANYDTINDKEVLNEVEHIRIN
jgi:Tfp pilus assembly protein PilO